MKQITTATSYNYPTVIAFVTRALVTAALVSMLSVAVAQEGPVEKTALSTMTSANPTRSLAHSLAIKDWSVLRAWFHQPQFHLLDGLDVYNENYRNSDSPNFVRLSSRQPRVERTP